MDIIQLNMKGKILPSVIEQISHHFDCFGMIVSQINLKGQAQAKIIKNR